MGSVYNATLKESIRTERGKLKDAERSYSTLTNKESEFANDILAWIKVKRRIIKVYEDSKL
jgi:hypothetical protein